MSDPYHAALAGFADMAAAEGDEVHPEARTTLLEHGDANRAAYVLIHGLTASPGQFRAFGARLHERGANVLIPRMPRHGLLDRLTHALAGLHPDELTSFARESVAIGRGLGESLTVLGFSVGGMLTAWIAQREDVDRAVVVAPFLGYRFLPSALGPVVAKLALAQENRFLWWDPRLKERMLPAYGYPRWPTHAVAHTFLFSRDLLEEAREVAPRAHHIMLVLNDGETTVRNSLVRELGRRWSERGARVELHRLALTRSHDIFELSWNAPVARKAHEDLLLLLEPQA